MHFPFFLETQLSKLISPGFQTKKACKKQNVTTKEFEDNKKVAVNYAKQYEAVKKERFGHIKTYIPFTQAFRIRIGFSKALSNLRESLYQLNLTLAEKATPKKQDVVIRRTKSEEFTPDSNNEKKILPRRTKSEDIPPVSAPRKKESSINFIFFKKPCSPKLNTQFPELSAGNDYTMRQG